MILACQHLFELLGQEITIDLLWNSILKRFGLYDKPDKRNNPIPILSGSPGTGKSRFLDNIEDLLLKKTRASTASLPEKFLCINITSVTRFGYWYHGISWSSPSL